MTPPARLLAAALRLYQWTLRPLIPGCCRFEPGCSDYAVEALREHGAARGSALAAWRVLRCNPFCDGGYDPVPPCRCEDSKQGWALPPLPIPMAQAGHRNLWAAPPKPAKGPLPQAWGLRTPIHSDKWFPKASLWRGPRLEAGEAEPLALLPPRPAPTPVSLRRSQV